MHLLRLVPPLCVIPLLSCQPSYAPEGCGEGEGEAELFGPSLEGTASPVDFGTMPLNGMLHVAARNQDVPVTATVKTESIDATERAVDVDTVGPVERVLFEDLVPNTSYSVTLRIPPGEAPEGAQTARELNFTTTDVVDDVAPVFDGEPTIEAVRSVDGTSCSGDGTLVNILAPNIIDDGGVAGVKFFSIDTVGESTLRGFSLALPVVQTQETGIDAEFSMVAVDLAGNESEPLSVVVELRE